MISKLRSMEKKINDLETTVNGLENTVKTDVTDRLDMMIYKTDLMTKKLEAKLHRFEPMLVRILGYGETLKYMFNLETSIAGAIYDIHQWAKLAISEENKQSESETNGGLQEEGSNQEPELGPGWGWGLGPDSVQEEGSHQGPGPGSGSGSGPDPQTEPLLTGAEVGTASGKASVSSEKQTTKPVSPDITMTTATPKNSQDDAQETTTIVPSPPDLPPPTVAATGVSPPSEQGEEPIVPTPPHPRAIAGPDRLQPPVNPHSGLPPPPTVTVTNLPPTTVAATGVSPPSKQGENTKGKRSRGRTPNIGDRRSPRLVGTSRAPSPAPDIPSKRPSEIGDGDGGDPKRQKFSLS